MKRFAAMLVMALALLSAVASADTGTYKITDYQVELAPKSDGLVVISYQQTWLVESGHIPWITVGVPNSNFEITTSGGAVRTIAKSNDGSWSGVRIDLDQDYNPGQSFTVNFTIQQNKLFYADDKYYKLDFTPGWYDRAFIDRLDLSVHFFAPIDSVSTDPKPSRVEGQKMYWSKTKLGKGEKISISVQFPKSSFVGKMADENLKKGMSSGKILLIIVLVIVVFAFIIAVFTNGFDTGDDYSGGGGGGLYSGGHIYTGSSRGSSRSGGGGGGFGGRSSSCACACVSCACACACAGGGGAGCSRKLEHLCQNCGQNGDKEG